MPQAGLFSAILTAFLIESYKSLSPDNTVQALSQISQQLAAAAAGTVSNIPSSPAFVPSVSSIVCNAFWFISLGLSLACALIATLVQQWARNFLHKTRLRSAPSLRAPIFMYFYFGLKRFGMHRVVEVIPLLLHMSLLLFFAGLVSFLIPVNTTLTVIAAVILAIVGGVYIGLTLLPLQWLDCPYHTPLSTTSWLVWKALQRTWLTRCHSAHGVELANRAAAGSQVQSPLLMKLMTVSNGPHRAWLARSGDAESAGPETTNPVSTGLESANVMSTGPESFDSVHSSPSPVSAKTWLARCRTWFTRRHQAERVEPTFPYNPHPHPHHETMMKAMFHAAAEPSTERTGREYRALVWTMGSLADNSELEPFIQGIADRYEEHIRNLVRDPKVYLLDRIANLLDSCTTTILSPDSSAT
ncbi:hypothetical protein C8R46DRAFT_1093627 [Mycena filopes]|nr:hypothetical protein C8R46DRAFT_1093627 [Mycena filopes]